MFFNKHIAELHINILTLVNTAQYKTNDLLLIMTIIWPISPWPDVHSGHLKSIVPRARIGALMLWARAHTVAMRLALLPAAAVRPAILKVEAAAADLGPSDGRRAGRIWGVQRRRSVASDTVELLVLRLLWRLTIYIRRIAVLILVLHRVDAVSMSRHPCG